MCQYSISSPKLVFGLCASPLWSVSFPKINICKNKLKLFTEKFFIRKTSYFGRLACTTKYLKQINN